MDLKDLFHPDTHIRIEHRFGDSERISVDYLYQAFKQRLIEEVSTEGKKVDGQYTFFRLIDTTDQEASRG